MTVNVSLKKITFAKVSDKYRNVSPSKGYEARERLL